MLLGDRAGLLLDRRGQLLMCGLEMRLYLACAGGFRDLHLRGMAISRGLRGRDRRGCGGRDLIPALASGCIEHIQEVPGTW